MIRFLKLYYVKSPVREDGNAGIDFFVPEFTDKFFDSCARVQKNMPGSSPIFKENNKGLKCIAINPGERVAIPSGIKARLELPEESGLNALLEIDLVAENKSGVATKRGLDVGACEIDPNYQGEIHLSLFNTTNEVVYIEPGEKIVQLVPRVYVKEKIEVFGTDISEDDFYKEFKWSNRGTGGFGSTGTN